MPYRIGLGYDIHRLSEGRSLFLGGIEIPYIKRLEGHSDGDVLLHAICDALLGAVSAGDIGEHFPDTDPKYGGISSADLLKTVSDLIKGQGFNVINLDSVIIAREPGLSPFKKAMQQRIAQILGVDELRISIKAKTNNGFGELGEGKAIASYAVVIISRGD